MLIAKTVHPWKARQLVQFHSAEGLPHRIEHHPEDEFPFWIVRVAPSWPVWPGAIRTGPLEDDRPDPGCRAAAQPGGSARDDGDAQER